MTTTTANAGATQDQLFAAAAHLESAAGILAIPVLSPWTWHSQTYSHWHAVGFVLHELRRRPLSSPECERAWRHARVVCEGWLTEGSTATNLARPIRGLWEKVRGERENKGGDDDRRTGVAASGFGAMPPSGDNDGSDSNGDEPDGADDSLDSFMDMFQPEPGDLGDLCYTLMGDQYMGDFLYLGEDNVLGAQINDPNS